MHISCRKFTAFNFGTQFRDTPEKSQKRPILHISRYHSSRNFALYDDNGLIAVTVYKKGAETVQERLETDARTIADLQRQLAEQTARFREQATQSPPPTLTERFNVQTWRPPRQLPLIAEDLTAYRGALPDCMRRAGRFAVACFLPKRLGKWYESFLL
jgi:hypothetical protein